MYIFLLVCLDCLFRSVVVVVSLCCCLCLLHIFTSPVLLKQLGPPNGTSACPGDVIQLVCNTTFQNETTLTWQVIGGESQIIFKNIQDAFSGALQLPNGGNATWEAKTLSDNATGICTSSLTINASPDLHNVTIACCSENSPSPCNDLAAIPNDYKGIAVINISKLRQWCSLNSAVLHVKHYT